MIPFLDLPAQYRDHRPEIEEAVVEALRSGEYVLGASVERVRGRSSPPTAAPSTRSPSTPAPPRCTSRCSPPASVRATR